MPSPAELEAFYRDYLRTCNEHRFDDLAPYVAADVEVNGAVQGRVAYAAGLAAVVAAFPDYTWQLQHLLIDGDRIWAHFRDVGTHRGTYRGIAATGREVSTQEFALYRTDAGRIVQVWVTADELSVVTQLTARDA
jgi:predicted ester cyclase